MSKQACLEAHEHVQELRDTHRYREAKQQALLCSQPSCPGLARQDCAPWAAELEKLIPRVTFEVLDASGQPQIETRIAVDGNEIASSLDGRSFDFDPGPHVLVFTLPAGAKHTERLLLTEGEGLHKVRVVLPAAPPSPSAPLAPATPTDRPGRSPWPSTGPLVVGGIGVALLLNAGVFGLISSSKFSTLQGTCAPSCTDAQTSDWRLDKKIAFTSLGTGLAAIAAAGIWWSTEW